MINRLEFRTYLKIFLPGIFAWLLCFADNSLGWPMLLLGVILSVFQFPLVWKKTKAFRWLFAGTFGWLIGSVSSLFIWKQISACRMVDSSLKFWVLGGLGLLGSCGIALCQYWAHWHRLSNSKEKLMRLLIGYGFGGFLAFELYGLDLHLSFFYSLHLELLLLPVGSLCFGIGTGIAIKPFLNEVANHKMSKSHSTSL